MKLTLAAIGAAGIFLAAAPVWAHHAFAAEFDENRPIKLEGVVTKWELVNPHSWIHMDVKDDPNCQQNCAVTNWSVEGGSPNALLRKGFTKNSLPAGTEIIVEGYQAKDGANRGVASTLTYKKDGRRIFMGSANGDGKEDK
jgi:Family of unknown function (DUF6152)